MDLSPSMNCELYCFVFRVLDVMRHSWVPLTGRPGTYLVLQHGGVGVDGLLPARQVQVKGVVHVGVAGGKLSNLQPTDMENQEERKNNPLLDPCHHYIIFRLFYEISCAFTFFYVLIFKL